MGVQSASWAIDTAVVLSASPWAVKRHLATRQFLPPSLCVRRLSQNLLLLEAKKPSSVLQPVFIHSQTIPSGAYTDMVHSTRIVLPSLSLYEEQTCPIPAFILPDYRPSFFCLLPALAPCASRDTSSPWLNHYILTSFALKIIIQNWEQDMKCDLSAAQSMKLIFCSTHLMWYMTKSQYACYWWVIVHLSLLLYTDNCQAPT